MKKKRSKADPPIRQRQRKAAVARLVQALGLGATKRLACKYAGIAPDTMYRWAREFPDVSDQLEKAEGEAAVAWLAKIERAANEGSWQAAAWKLERNYPGEYGRTRLEVTTPPDQPFEASVSVGATIELSDEDRDLARRGIEAYLGRDSRPGGT